MSALEGLANGELWIPRTMWEKRRQLSAVLHRGFTVGCRLLILSCDDWTAFFGRIDVARSQCDDALMRGQIEYQRVSPQRDAFASSAGPTDLSRVLGEIVLKYHDRFPDQVVVDDVDLILDLRDESSARASLFALLYALRGRFQEIVLFANPMRSERALGYLGGLRDLLLIHQAPSLPTTEPVAA